ncbi:MAG: UDP-N-acetylmuramoyl-L-alanyl-D-glutamate--2,6-diaminopimelate ligase [Candidatus Eremiobacteraeota bacterium]|nr:UDP-N-acetylmuramoyl-L-alanyl-D-glutamate--2,6-diaminopimelate ligase [Candidatus Eremiobacteraeota bacterium]
MLLARLLEVLEDAVVDGAIDRNAEIDGLTVDSRTAGSGALFVALRGEHVDAHRFVANALAGGAVAAVVERDAEGERKLIRVPDTRLALSKLAARFYGQPSHALRVAGITGTNGKTTTSYLVRAVLDACGIPCGHIGTLGASYREWTRELANTTPLPIELHETLAAMRDLGARAVAMEVSSHALALHRVDDIRFAVGAFTNLTRDHLDFHGTFESYAAAKRRLFDLAASAVIGVDDATGARWAAELRAVGLPTVDYALDAPAELRATAIATTESGTTFELKGTGIRVELPLTGRFNVANALCALGIARALGCDLHVAANALHAVAPVPGRMERYVRDGVLAIVDYAHTPDALANVLRAARDASRGRLFVVFGCGGDRDAGKRPEMGAVANELADVVVVTSDNPRSEDPATIARAIVAAVPRAEIELDRRAAIRRAIGDARAGDVVVVAGKGHEAYQTIGDVRAHFDDRDEVRAALAARPEELKANA